VKEAGRVQIKLNGEAKDVAEGTTLLGLVEELSLSPERLAVELNREVVRRARWPSVVLGEGDRVEIVHFVGGGCGPRVRRFPFPAARV
jgi:thiamine biosynthesis protein ThiS